jgi:hypothetical protein
MPQNSAATETEKETMHCSGDFLFGAAMGVCAGIWIGVVLWNIYAAGK